MKKGLIKLVLTTAVIITTMSMISFAGEWKQDGSNWWYQNDDGSYPTLTWQEIDGKQYYFDGNGYMLHDTTTPDGYTVGSDGVWIQESKPSEEVSIQIPTPTGYGFVKGNVTWQYNNYIGTKADVGAIVYLIPLDFSIKGGDNNKLSMFMDTKGNNGVYFAKVDGFGQYTLDNIPTGKYRIFIKSENTTSAFRFEDEASWNKTINNLMGDILNKTELDKFKTFLGFDDFYTEEIEITNDKTNNISYDFGYTYI